MNLKGPERVIITVMRRFDPIESRTDPESLAHYGRDWTRFWPARPAAVVFPRNTAEVVELVGMARREGFKLVPSGGRTGLSGGAVASHGEVVVSLEKMRAIIELDSGEPSLRAQAGVPVGEIQRAAREAGLCYPVDWAAAASSQLGGSIATNAGGIRVLRFGMTRAWVRDLTVVTGMGEVLELNRGLVKNNAGFDLGQLVIGSEGVLGIITEARVGLIRPPPEQSVLLLGLSDLEAIMPVFAELRAGLNLSAFEFFDRRSVEHVGAASGESFPLDEPCPYYAIVEFDDPDQASQDQALELFEKLLTAGHLLDGTLGQSGAQAAALWRWREAISEAISPRTPYKNDLAVRVSRVPEFLAALDRLVGEHYPDFEVVWFGHIGDGNLHMNVLRPERCSITEFHAACRDLSRQVFELVQAFEGSVSAEHGVGLLKRDVLHYSRSAAEISLMRQVKAAFDPDGILNPGKVFTQ